MLMYVAIINKATGIPNTVMGPMGWREADQVERGASINLDHKNWKIQQRRDKTVPDAWLKVLETSG